jgi:hypothetical protein
LRFNLWGFNVGGPVKFHKGGTAKTFFFYNMEWRREILGGGVNVAVPFSSTYGGNLADAVAFNAAHGNALFNNLNAPYSCQVSAAVQTEFAAAGQAMSGCTGGAPDSTKAQPFVFNGQTNVINPALINPNAALLLKAGIFPAQTSTTTDLFHGGQNAPTNVREEIVRIDHTFNSHWSIFGHFIDESLVNQTDVPARWAWVNLPTSSDTFGNPSYQAVVHVANTISPTLLNETAFNYGGNRINITPLGVFNIPSGYSEHRLFSGPNTILPQIFVIGKTGDVYNQNWSPWDNTADSYQLRDDLAWTKGKHQFKFGGSWLWFKKLQPLQDSPQGGFQFGGGYTGYDFADFLLGLSNSYSEAALKDSRHWNSVSWAAYAEDDWRVTPRLTLNLGLRWDGIPHTAEVNGQQSNFYLNLWNATGAAAAFGYVPGGTPVIGGTGFADSGGNTICTGAGIPNSSCTGANPYLASGPNPALNGLLSYDLGLGIAGKNGISKGLVGNHWDTFGPRIGFAYDVTGKGKTIVRSGIGIFYERIQGNDMYQSGANNLFGGNPTIGNVSLSDPHIGIGPSGAVISAAQLPVTVNGLTALNPNAYKIPTSTQYSAGVQQQLSSRTVLSVAYVGNMGRHESYATEINMPALNLVTSPTFFWSGGNNTGNANLYRPYLGYGSIKMDENAANSDYNSLQVSLRSQMRDLTLQAAYTYSHAHDAANNASNGGDGGDLDYVTNPYAGWKYDWGPSEYNRQNIAFFNFVYDVPFLRKNSNRLLRDVVGGWQVSGVVTMESGLPITLTVGGGLKSVCTSVGTCGNIRPNLVGPITYPKTAATLSTGLGSMQWLSPSAFAANLLPGNSSVATWGSLGYDGAWGPGRDNWNLALFKNFAFTERMHMELRFESFNTFNHPQMNGVDLGVGDTDFGKINSAYDPRVLQLGAKIVF